MRVRGQDILLWSGLGLVLVAVSLVTRPLMPIDETRYAAVAWEMWLRGDFLVPYLNGETYSHKPPLLFWLFQLGWTVFGVNEWWPRVVPALFAMGSVFLTARIAALLWPDQPAAARTAPVILLGSLLWAVFTTVVYFDLLLAFFTLLGMRGILLARDGGAARGWGLVGLALGFGILAKGPVVLLHVLPAALLAPWWMGTHRRPWTPWTPWYAGVAGAVLLGAAIALAWAIPAALAGGPEYANAIFWGQTAGRVVQSFAHRHPWWWYLPLLPLILFPWLAWPALWSGIRALKHRGPDDGVRFCLAWGLPVLAALSFVSGKQPQYLLPLFPAFALLAARALLARMFGQERWSAVLPGFLFALAGLALAAAPYLAEGRDWPAWTGELSVAPGLVLAVLGAALMLLRWRNAERAAAALAAGTVVAVVVLHLEVPPAMVAALDLHPLSRQLAAWQANGDPIAHTRKYHGQYQFLGRLERPLEVIRPEEMQEWGQRHPAGHLIVYYQQEPPDSARLEYGQPYRGGYVAVWSSRDAGIAAQAALDSRGDD